jgi:hypothetical protein
MSFRKLVLVALYFASNLSLADFKKVISDLYPELTSEQVGEKLKAPKSQALLPISIVELCSKCR